MSDESRIERLEEMVELLAEALFQDGKLAPTDIDRLHNLLDELWRA